MVAALSFEQHRADLEWAERTLAAQPADVLQLYRQTAQAIAGALMTDITTFSVEFPPLLYPVDSPAKAAKPLILHAGNLLNTLQRQPCRAAILEKITAFSAHRDTASAKIARLVAYMTGDYILLHHIPTVDQIKSATYQSFTTQGQLTTDPDNAGKAAEQLSAYVDHMHLIERLFPAWGAGDLFNEKYGPSRRS
jgi:hypothetical protein